MTLSQNVALHGCPDLFFSKTVHFRLIKGRAMISNKQLTLKLGRASNPDRQLILQIAVRQEKSLFRCYQVSLIPHDPSRQTQESHGQCLFGRRHVFPRKLKSRNGPREEIENLYHRLLGQFPSPFLTANRAERRRGQKTKELLIRALLNVSR